MKISYKTLKEKSGQKERKTKSLSYLGNVKWSLHCVSNVYGSVFEAFFNDRDISLLRFTSYRYY